MGYLLEKKKRKKNEKLVQQLLEFKKFLFWNVFILNKSAFHDCLFTEMVLKQLL